MKNILITGASSGLGREIAVEYSSQNTNLYLIARNIQELEKAKKICEDRGATVYIQVIDVKNKQEMKNYLESLNVNFDIVFANAGISSGTAENFEEEDKIYNIFETNIMGVLNTITPIVQKMIKNRSGRIVLISSMASFRGMSTAPAYSASKACVRFYGEALNNYLKQYNVDVNVVCPGFIKTPLTDKNNFPMPFLMDTKTAVKKIVNSINKNKKFIIFPKILYYFITFLNILPFGIDDYIFSKLSKHKFIKK
ncbi:MAG: SDR family NAD(P)-dependent oxidoreductase [Rickettsiales bacterium]|nr:SDR family NAD(P)-dependent oxidoreductase [Rickettsiales bacterium]